jgi:antitoxin VapB
MDTAKVFRSGNSQVVRLPKQYRFESSEVLIFRRGDEVVLREKPKSLERAFDLICDLPEFGREDTLPQEREGL